MKIDPKVLRRLREQKGWSQADLAANTKVGKEPPVNKDTISRLERGTQGATRASVAAKIARSLSVDINVLIGNAPIPESKSKDMQITRSSIQISDQARNALHLIYERYYIQPWQIVEMAPVLFCWAAEASLRARQSEIDAVQLSFDTACEHERRVPHLVASELGDLRQKIAAEKESIEERDLLAFKVEDAGFANFKHDWDNPFSRFLRGIFSDFGDVITFEGFSILDYPEYFVCPEEANWIAGGDKNLSKMILDGHIALSEVPKEFDGNFDARVEWIRTKGEEFKAKISSQILSHQLAKKKEAQK